MPGNDDEAAKKAAADDEAAKKAAADGEAAKKAAADDEAAKKAAADDEAAKKAAVDETGISETLDATVAEGASAPAFETPGEKGYDPGKYQDTTRSYIAYWLLFLLTLLVLGGFGMLFAINAVTFENLKSILELIFGPIVALVSAATGFYFGAQQPGKKP